MILRALISLFISLGLYAAAPTPVRLLNVPTGTLTDDAVIIFDSNEGVRKAALTSLRTYMAGIVTNGTVNSLALNVLTNNNASADRAALFNSRKELTNSPSVSATELETLDGSTSALQTQLNRIGGISVRELGAAGDGSTDDMAIISAAISSSNTIRFPAGNYLISNDLTFALGKNLVFEFGAKLKPASGRKITINSSVIAGRWEIFDYSAGGKCVFGIFGGTDAILPEWYGARPDNTITDNATPFARIFDQTLGSTENQQPVLLATGYYDFSTGFTGRSGMAIRGHPSGKTRLQFSPTASSGTVRFITLPTACDNVVIERVQINARAVTAGVRTIAVGHADAADTLTDFILDHVHLSGWNQYALNFGALTYARILKSKFVSISNISANGGTESGSAICLNIQTFGNAITIDQATRTSNCEQFLRSASSAGLKISGESSFEQGANAPLDIITGRGSFIEILSGSSVHIEGNYFEGISTSGTNAIFHLTNCKDWSISENQIAGLRPGGSTNMSAIFISQNGTSYGGKAFGNDFYGTPTGYYIFSDGTGGPAAAIFGTFQADNGTVQTTYSQISSKFSADVGFTTQTEWNFARAQAIRLTTGTTAVLTAMTLEKKRSGGAGSANDGVAIQSRAMNASGSVQNIGAARWIYADASNGNEKSNLEFQLLGNGPITTPLTLLGTGGMLAPIAAINPAAPAANNGVLYFDSSGGKVRLMVRFPTGAAQQVAIEP